MRYVKQKKQAFPKLHGIMVEGKTWVQKYDVKMKGYFMEILCVKEFQENGPAPTFVHLLQHQCVAKDVKNLS